MLKGIKEQRTLVAFIFYILAIALAIVECFIESKSMSFPLVITAPILFFIYYILLSIMIDENKMWPLVALVAICLILYDESGGNFICEILEIAFFVIEIITAFVIKFIRGHRRKKPNNYR